MNLYAENGDSMGFMTGRAFLGEPVLRQYRVQRVPCDVHKLLYESKCWASYSSILRETGSYAPEWQEGGSSGHSAWAYSGSREYPDITGKSNETKYKTAYMHFAGVIRNIK